jgi:hypothetical protein
MESVATTTEERIPRGAPRLWVCLLYLLVTAVLNLSVLAMWPKIVTPAIATQCLTFCIIPIIWGVYLPFRCRRSFEAWFVSGLAVLGAAFWGYVAVGLVVLILRP